MNRVQWMLIIVAWATLVTSPSYMFYSFIRSGNWFGAAVTGLFALGAFLVIPIIMASGRQKTKPPEK